MPTILFVHGTGVREPAYSRSFRVVKARVEKLPEGWKAERCYWGETAGVQLKTVKTVPPGRNEGDAEVRGVTDRASDLEMNNILWQMLYVDPLFELRWFEQAGAVKSAGGEELLAPGQQAPGAKLRKKLKALTPTAELKAELSALDLDKEWDSAVSLVVGSNEVDAALKSNDSELPSVVARALIAATISLGVEGGAPAPNAEQRTALVNHVISMLGGQTLGVKQTLLAPLGGLATRIGTWYGVNNRSLISGEAAPAAGDVILYQTRGEKIRAFIEASIKQCAGPVYVLAHSLGGIASVDLMAMSPPTNVRGLITVGSQAPLLYEFDALVSLPQPKPLPKTFPRWLNIFDTRDFLSYMAEPVFDKTIVKDVQVKSGESFPQSHSAYWNLDAVWQNIEEFVTSIEKEHAAKGT